MDRVSQIFESCSKSAWSLAVTLTANAADADDVVQQAFLVVVSKEKAVPEPAWPWVAAVIANCARNHRRKASKVRPMEQNQEFEIPSRDKPAEQNLDQAELKELLFAALKSLPEQEREAVSLCHIAGLSLAEASGAAGVGLEALKSRLRRGMAHLRDMLKKDQERIELYLTAALIKPPEDGWESAIARWEEYARTHARSDVSGSVGSGWKWFAASSAAVIGVTALVLFGNVDQAVWSRSSSSVASETRGSNEVDTNATAGGVKTGVSAASQPSSAIPEPTPGSRVGEPPAPAETTETVLPAGPNPVGTSQVRTLYFKSGQMYLQQTELMTARGPIRQGPYTRHFFSGAVEESGDYVNNEREGIWTIRHENGQVKVQAAYHQGKRVGRWTYFLATGEKQIEGEYELGLKQGQWTSWHKNGQISRIEHFQQGKRTGTSTDFDEAGGKTRETTWLNDKKHGPETTFDGQGNATLRRYDNGKQVD